ncbi:hypothetical protein HRG_008379 [Hirsutella rhossiliensis]|uniref:Uncharacterized protein n=1 Tax=Hirsutella rhossiliensis TaxID=111463 RepID=A0A9P8MTP0_9HYPO|nr:uncharacterized protein HRG_08379 [Hirsutella rhossiliensis]KAH0960224.1 hypothetical protein HRG_08379 [Hirsutella rhossiliensis]
MAYEQPKDGHRYPERHISPSTTADHVDGQPVLRMRRQSQMFKDLPGNAQKQQSWHSLSRFPRSIGTQKQQGCNLQRFRRGACTQK